MRPSTIGITHLALIIALGIGGILSPDVSTGQTGPGLTATGDGGLHGLSSSTILRSPVGPDGSGDALAICRTRSKSNVHRQARGGSPTHTSFLNFKYGTYNPEGNVDGGSFFGFRTGAEFENRLTLAFNFDAFWRSYTEEALIAQETDPNGNLIRTSVTSLETSSTLIPLGVSLGLRLPGSRTLTPFIGVGIAYEILVNDVKDYQTGMEDTNVYGGPGWQVFGGLMFPITTNARFLGELWYNDAEVSRNVESYESGLPVREKVDVSGIGARLGVEFAWL
jgi:hypothetical protein